MAWAWFFLRKNLYESKICFIFALVSVQSKPLKQSREPLADIVEKLNVNKDFLQKSNLNKIFANGGKLAEQPKAKNDFLHQKSIK